MINGLIGFYVKYSLFLSDLMMLNFLDIFPKNIQMWDLMKIHSVGAELLLAYGRKDMMKLILAFCNSVSAPKKGLP